MPPVARIPALVVLARVRLRRGDPGVSQALDEAAELAFASGEVQRISSVVAARAEAAWLEGTLADSLDEIARGYKMTCKISDSWMQGELAFWLWRAGRLTEATAQIAQPWALQIACDWQGAAAGWEAINCPYERALALAECQNESAVRTALQIFERLGAAPMAGITRRKLRKRGVRNIPRGRHERTKQNPHQLTRRQLQVLALLAEGCRNARDRPPPLSQRKDHRSPCVRCAREAAGALPWRGGRRRQPTGFGRRSKVRHRTGCRGDPGRPQTTEPLSVL